MAVGWRKYHLAVKFQILNQTHSTFCLFSEKNMMPRVYCTAIAGITLFNPWQHHFPTYHSSTVTKVNEHLIIRGNDEPALSDNRKIAHVIQHCTSILFWSREKDFAEASDHQEKRQVCISIQPWWNGPLCIRYCSNPSSAQKYRQIVSTAQAEEMKVIFRAVISI